MIRIGSITKKGNNVSSARIALWYLIGDMLVKGLSVLTTPVFSRVLTKQQYGDFSNFTSWEAILLVIITLDLSVSISRAKYDYTGKMDAYISSVTAVSTLSTAVIYLIIECNSAFFSDLFSMDMFYIRLLFLYFLFEPAYEYMQTKHRMYMKYKFFLLFSLCSAFLRTGVSLLLVFLMEDKLKGRILGYIVPALILYMCIYCYVWAKGHKVKWEYCKYALKIGVPMIPHTLSVNLLSSSDRIMIRELCGAEEAAVYTISYTVASAVTLVRASLNKAWTPWFFDALAAGEHDRIRQRSRTYVDMFLLLMVGIMLVAPEIVLVLGGKQYYEARFIVPPVMSGLVCQFLYTLYVNVETFYKKTFSISVGTMTAALLNIVLNLIFIPQFGYMAAAYTTLAGYLVLLLIHFGFVKFRIRQAQLFYNKNFFLKLCCFIGARFVCSGLYRMDYVRYIVVCAYAAVMLYVGWKKRAELLKMFHFR